MSELIITLPESPESVDFKPYLINGYLLKSPLKSNNSGFSKWGFCEKSGREYFIKEFLSPVYPLEGLGLDEEIRQKKIDDCKKWYDQKKKIYTKIVKSQNGNIISPIAFFRNGSHFYLVTDKVKKSNLDYNMISKLDISKKLIIMKVLVSCLKNLAKSGIVHADLKLDNLIFKETKNGFFTVKVIDFDASYFEKDPPFGDEIQGDPVYYAPETFLAIIEESAELTSKVDVFALGIIFHQILSGELPGHSSEYDYVYEAVLNDDDIKISDVISKDLQELILGMLKKDVKERLSIMQVFNILIGGDSTSSDNTNNDLHEEDSSENKLFFSDCFN